jgi:hypothetical protein
VNRAILAFLTLSILAAPAVAADAKVTGEIVIPKNLPAITDYTAVVMLSYVADDMCLPLQTLHIHGLSHEAGKETRKAFEIGGGEPLDASGSYFLALTLEGGGEGSPIYVGKVGKEQSVPVLTNKAPSKVIFRVVVDAPDEPQPQVDPPVKPGVDDPKSAELKTGDAVWAEWKVNEWFQGKLGKKSPKGFTIEFDDGDTAVVKTDKIALDRVPEKKAIAKGTRVLAEWDDGRLYPATVTEVRKDGTYAVKYDDGAEGNAVLKKMRLISK